MRVLHFDSETTGLPVHGAPSNDPRHPKIVTLSAILDDADGNEVSRVSYIVKPEGWEIDETGEAFKVHGITQAKALAEGHPISHVIEAVIAMAAQADVLSAYNFHFDFKLLKIACANLGDRGEQIRQSLEAKSSICTMEAAAMHLIGRKRMKLTEAHAQLLGTTFDGAHTSMADTEASRSVFYKLKSLNALPQPKSMARPAYATPLEAT
jgi:DNA polymerase III epsilon subunit-like protein